MRESSMRETLVIIAAFFAAIGAALYSGLAWRARSAYRLVVACWCLVVGHRWLHVGSGTQKRKGFREQRVDVGVCQRCATAAFRRPS